jgi:hypothetical protein
MTARSALDGPAVMPLTNHSERNRFRTSTGRVAIISPVASMPMSWYSSETRNWTASGSVRIFCWVMVMKTTA